MKIRSRMLAVAAALVCVTGFAQAGNLHVFTSDAEGFNTHSIWYDDGKEVLVVDTQFTPIQARALIAEIKRQTKSPITRVVVTHPNPDKFNALSVFHQEGAESIASVRTAAAIPGVDAYKRYFWVNMAKAFTDETYPKVEPIRTTFEGETRIRLKSGETVTLIELPRPGISSTQTVVRIDQSGDLVVGDLVHTRNHAWLEGGIVNGKPQPDLAGWKADLQELPKLGNGKVYGGRGEFAPVRDAVAQEIAYLEQADRIVDRYIQQLGSRAAELKDPQKQGGHYAAIQAEFVKAFPDYSFPDLVGYSVYGLVQQKLSQQSL